MAAITLRLKGFKCERCEHTWIPRKKNDYPIICPSCKSAYWDKAKK